MLPRIPRSRIGLLIVFAMIRYAPASATEPGGPKSPESSNQRVFMINNCIVDLNEFQKLVKSAERLKPFGRVQINISTLAQRSFNEVPKERSPWYDYASDNSTPYKFFPHVKLVPFVPAAAVAKNRQLLLAKAKILRDHGMEAAFFGSEPNMLPRAFFDAHPEMLGPRVDHPRRSNHAAFTPCVSTKETQEMYTAMLADMLRSAPEIKSFYFKTNDAGTGICWGHWLYTGANGPSHCKNESMGHRVTTLMNAFRDGAERAGTALDVYLSEGSSNFSDAERDEIQALLPDHCYYRSTAGNELVSASGIFPDYPISGIIDPFSFFQSVSSLSADKRQTVFITYRSWYSKGNENARAMDLSLAMLADYLTQQSSGNKTTDEELVRQLAQKWAASQDVDKLYDAFTLLHEAFRFKQDLGNILPVNWNVAARMINRPLVVAPQRLTRQEEAYFLPFVFNVSEEAARLDYIDIQGARRTTRPDSIKIYVDKILNVCKRLEAIGKDAPQYTAIREMALALRIDASFARSCGNFFQAQLLRDKNKEKLEGPNHRPDKIPTWSGDEDLLGFNEVMRDELDNTQDLISVLKGGGINLLIHAKTSAEEDCFLLGPEVLGQMVNKRRIMLDHWRDIEDYMTTPFK